MDPELELQTFRFLVRLRATLRGSKSADQALRSALRHVARFVDADRASIALLPPGSAEPVAWFRLPRGAKAPLELQAEVLRGGWPAEVPAGTLLAAVQRRNRLWAALALERREPFAVGLGKALARIAEALSELVHEIDHERMRDVRAKIDQKIIEELPGKDLFYQILHGLRSLTGYDHSSSLLIPGRQGQVLEMVAEQIAWTKAKSERIGARIRIDEPIAQLLELGAVYGFERDGDGGPWREWTGYDAAPIASLLDRESIAASRGESRGESRDESIAASREESRVESRDESRGGSHAGATDEEPLERSMLCAALAGREGPLGLLRIASCHPGALGPYEAELVTRFLPQVSVAFQNSRRTENLQANLVAAERKSAMADLARSVAHDVNNALGAILPLVQQIRGDLATGEKIEPETLSGDMEQIEESLLVCRRIFGGMLSFARGSTKSGGVGEIAPAVQSSLKILEDGMKRRHIRRLIDLPDTLPRVRASQPHLEQLFFNLLANARDAMPQGGELRVSVEPGTDAVHVTVEDTGDGIAPEDLPRIQEPFFTTKRQGTGLGLSIVRNLLWEMRGKVNYESERGRGTKVKLELPIAPGEPRPETTRKPEEGAHP